MLFERYAELKYKLGNRNFWAVEYYVSMVGPYEATIRKYIQEKKDIMGYKITSKEYKNPFKG